MEYHLSARFGESDPGGGMLLVGDGNGTLNQYAFDVNSTSWAPTGSPLLSLSERQSAGLTVNGDSFTALLYGVDSGGNIRELYAALR